MISKSKLTDKGIPILDDSTITCQRKLEIISAIAAVEPSLVNELNEIDIETLICLLSEQSPSKSVTGYELQFAGKNIALHEADSKRKMELKVNTKLSRNFNTTKNSIIIGDNIHALKILYQNYFKKIKMIYIDPPYNRDSDQFVYSDQFRKSKLEIQESLGLNEEEIEFIFNIFQSQTHSGWLTFIYPRLKLARELLSDDGVLFISIDDVEVSNLYIICKELFGENNVDCFIWSKTGEGRDGKMKNTTTFRKDHEYILIAYKKSKKLNKSLDYPKWQNSYENFDNDPRGPYKPGSISRKESDSNPNSQNYYEVTSPSGKSFVRQFDVSFEKFQKLDVDNRIYWGKTSSSVPAIKIFEKEKRETNTSSILTDGTTTDGSKELDKLLCHDELGREFRPKPVSLIKKLVQIGTSKTSNEIVLDFFAGSGTTAEAVMRMNAEDGGTRRFVLVQLDEPIKKLKSPNSYEFCSRIGMPYIIPSITLMRIKHAANEIRNSNEPYASHVDVGLRVFEMVPRPCVRESSKSDLPGFEVDHNRKSSLDILFNLLATTCETLDSQIETLLDNRVYRVKNNYFIVSPVDESEMLEDLKGNQIYLDGWGQFDVNNFLSLKNSGQLMVVY